MLLQNSGIHGRRTGVGPGAILFILVTILLLAGERLSFIESSYYDFLQSQQQKPVDERILLLDTGSQVPGNEIWDSTVFSPVVDALNDAGAALIVPVQAPPPNSRMPDFDQLAALAELESRILQNSDNNTAESNGLLTGQLAGFRKQYEEQETILSTVRDAGNLVLPMSDQGSQRGVELTGNDCQRHTVFTSAANAAKTARWVKETNSVLMLPDRLCEGAANAGYGEYWPDSDGVIRRTHLFVKSGSRIFPSLSLAIAQANLEASTDDSSTLELDGAHRIMLANLGISTGPDFTSLIRFYHSVAGNPAFATVSTDDLLSGDLPNEMFRDRIVLVGNLKADSKTGYRTPFSQTMPPVVLLATAVSNLLQMDFVLRPYWLGSVELVLLIVLGIIIFVSAPTMTINRAATVIVALAVGLMATEAYLLIAHGIWVQLVTATLFTILGIGSVQAVDKFRLTADTGNQPASKPEHSAPADTGNQLADTDDQLDLAFSVLRQQPPTDETKKRLYGIAVTHGKMKEYAKAERVLVYLAAIDPNYRDVSEKLKKLSGARKKPVEVAPAETGENASAESAESGKSIRTLGRYQIDKVLGKGAMATVYLGTDPSINREVAIKTIALAEEFSDADLEAARAQFRREAESAGRLNHPNIIAIYDTGEDHNVAYLAMEYFHGKPLNYYTQSSNMLPPKWVLELTARAAEALHYAHGQGVVHRDIKPANLMYDAASDMLKITDFGIARLTDTSRTKTGIILGTPSYMSPEQLAASAVTGKSDLYSLGITMFQLLTGTTPFRSDSIPKLMDKIINDKHKPVSSIRDDVPLCVDVVLDQALAKNPDDRFANGRTMALALRDCVKSFEDR